MGLSQEVRFKIGGDTTNLAASFRQSESLAQASGRKMEEAFQKAARVRQHLTPREARAADREYKTAVERVNAERNLAAFRKKAQFEEANTAGKIRIVTNELADLARRRANAEAGSTKQLGLQLAIEERMVALRKLQRQQQAANLVGTPSAAESAASGADQGRSGLLSFGQLAFRAIGGAIAGVLGSLGAFQQSRIKLAQAQEESGAAGLGSLRARFAAIGGLQGQLTQGRGTLKDLENKRLIEQQRVEFLKTPAQMAGMAANQMFGDGFEPLIKAEEAVQNLNAEIQKQHDANALIERDLNKQRAIREAMLSREKLPLTPGAGVFGGVRNIGGVGVGKEIGSVPETAAAARGGQLNDVTRARIERDRLRKVRDAERRFGTPESARAAYIALRQSENDLAQSRQAMGQRQRDVMRDLTGQAAEGRTFRDGRARPRSETERIAQRAQQFRQTARDRVLTGAGDDAPMFMEAAMRDERNVAARLSGETAGVRKQDVSDASGIKSEVSRSNELLQSIADALKQVDVE